MPSGRPRSPHKRNKSLTVTLTAAEYLDLQAEAIARRITLANLVRERLGLELAAYSTPCDGGKK